MNGMIGQATSQGKIGHVFPNLSHSKSFPWSQLNWEIVAMERISRRGVHH
jgi:hypothetical protein